MVESWPESLKIDSSNADVCSGVVPCFEGIEARGSFSTYGSDRYVSDGFLNSQFAECKTYSDFKIDKLFWESTHLIVEAKPVLSDLCGSEDEVALSLFLFLHNNSFVWTDDLIIHIKRSTSLNLCSIKCQRCSRRYQRPGASYSEVKGYFGTLFVDIGVKACFFIGAKLVCEGSGRHKRRNACQKATPDQRWLHDLLLCSCKSNRSLTLTRFWRYVAICQSDNLRAQWV